MLKKKVSSLSRPTFTLAEIEINNDEWAIAKYDKREQNDLSEARLQGSEGLSTFLAYSPHVNAF